MSRSLTVFITTMFFIFGITTLGLAGQGMKSDAAEENVPDNIQRSTPSAEKPLSGSGPGARSEQLTGMEDVSKNPDKAARAAEENVPENIQRSTPSAEKPLSGSGPGTRTDQLTEMEDVEPMKKGKKGISSKSSSQ